MKIIKFKEYYEKLIAEDKIIAANEFKEIYMTDSSINEKLRIELFVDELEKISESFGRRITIVGLCGWMIKIMQSSKFKDYEFQFFNMVYSLIHQCIINDELLGDLNDN